ncbi:hypothetical protein CUV01_18975 (plasmid) [Paracoccus tegillarcae]|uniref:Uncharacterized protein n=1 Tax=Paracoccus tegillarcae TaxID=1529068 RepID=A0A2K9EML2_9RHOB|nr:hypothetical protein CUV01_18975 [Paracoccus tegillarcae]
MCVHLQSSHGITRTDHDLHHHFYVICVGGLAGVSYLCSLILKRALMPYASTRCLRKIPCVSTITQKPEIAN